MQGTGEGQRKRRREDEEADERERKRLCNDGRISRIEGGVMEQGERCKLIELWWPRIKRICLVCFLLDEDWSDHHVWSCKRVKDELSRVGVKDWVVKKIQSKYEVASCCYKCSRPGDMCEAASVGFSQGCLEPDVIVPVVVMGWLVEEMGLKGIVEGVAGREIKDIDDLFGWMMRKHYERTLRYWGTRGFAVWVEMMIKNKERFEDELRDEFESDSDEEEEENSEDELSM
jgi:hypothetical protein